MVPSSYLLSFLLPVLRFETFFESEGLDVVDVFEMTVAGLAMWYSLKSSPGTTRVVESLPPPDAEMFSLDLDLIRCRSFVRDIFLLTEVVVVVDMPVLWLLWLLLLLWLLWRTLPERMLTLE